MEWSAEFYEKQYEWADFPSRWASREPDERTHVDAVHRLTGPKPKRILELGAGSGFTAASLASAGHEVVAVEQVPACVTSIERLAATVAPGSLLAVAGDFYEIEFDGSFDVVAYFDGFGIGSDDDQRRLLLRIRGWLSEDGCALLDVLLPSFWAKTAGGESEFPAGSGVRYREGFDPEGSRLFEDMRRVGHEDEVLRQSIRCYSPADLRLLLEGTGLTLAAVEPYTDQWYEHTATIDEAMLYLAKLVPG